MKKQLLAFILGIVVAICGSVVAQSISTLSADIITANTRIGSPAISTGATNTFIGTAASTGVTGASNTIVGATTGTGITTGSNNTVLGAGVTGLAAALGNNIILADGTGTIKAQHNNVDWLLTGAAVATKASAAQGIFTGWGAIGGAGTGSGQIEIATAAANHGVIQYASAGNTTLYIDNIFDNAAAEIRLRTRTAGTPINALILNATSAAFPGTVAASTGGAASTATCWKADGITLGHCTTIVGAGGGCTCA